jgi:hypothetical protein
MLAGRILSCGGPLLWMLELTSTALRCVVANAIDIGRLEYLIKFQTEIRNLAKPLESRLLTYLIEMACAEMIEMLENARMDTEALDY